MMKKLLKKITFALAFVAICHTTNAQTTGITVTFANVPTEVEIDGDLDPSDLLRFTVNNIPNNNLALTANFRYFSASQARHAQITFDIFGDQSGPKNAILQDGADADNMDGTFNRTFVAAKVPPRAGTAPEYTLADVFSARVRIVGGPSGVEDNDAEAGNTSGNLTSTVVADGELLSVKRFNISSKIYPNPVSTTLYIDSALETKSYKVVNLLGKEVKVAEAKGSLDVSSLSSGIYVLVTDEGMAKFVKY